MALFSNLPSGGGKDTAFNKDGLIAYKVPNSNAMTISCAKSHTNTATSVLLGTITASASWLIPYAWVRVTHTNLSFDPDETWYEIRDKHNNVLCMFTGVNASSGHNETTGQYASLAFAKGENYLYFCSHTPNGIYGGTAVQFYCQQNGGGYSCLSGTGSNPTLSWTEA